MINQIDIQKISILRENKVYRIADLFNESGIRFKSDINSIFTDSQYKNSILFDYFQSKQKLKDITTMQKVIDQHIDLYNYPIPEKNELVIHLRLGDLLNQKKVENHYYQMFEGLNKKINFKNFSKISIVTALHFGSFDDHPKGRPLYMFSEKTKEKSFNLFRFIESQINTAGHSVNLISSDNIDQDFCYMSKSQWFVKSKRGFSFLICGLLPESAKFFCLNKQEWSSKRS